MRGRQLACCVSDGALAGCCEGRNHPHDLRLGLLRGSRQTPASLPRGVGSRNTASRSAPISQAWFPSRASLPVHANRRNGRTPCAPWRKDIGVDPSILVSIWGIESSYGGGEQRWDVFRSLATLAEARFHHPFFRDELLSALKILQDDHIPRREFVGSWAGAMGQAQFLPSSFLRYAVDFDGDGKADIWRSVPDVLASIANYLQKTGWQKGLPWGFEVRVSRRASITASAAARSLSGPSVALPAPTDSALPTDDAARPFSSFRAAPRDRRFSSPTISSCSSDSTIRTPMPLRRACFRTGCAVCLRFAPVGRPTTSSLHAMSASRCNTDSPSLGYKIAEFEGHLDFDLRDAVRDQQRRFGMIPDGYPSRAFLDRVGVRTP